jgi:hypothetical protein
MRVGPGPVKGLGRTIVCWRRAQVAGRRHRAGIRRVGKRPAGEWSATWRGSCYWSSHGHALGRCRVLLPPDVVMRPGRFNIRVRRVLVVMDVAFGPIQIPRKLATW